MNTQITLRGCFFLLAILVTVLLVGCGHSANTSAMEVQFKEEFGLQEVQQHYDFREEYNSYSGVPYEGIAVYSFSVEKNTEPAFDAWEHLPYQTKAADFLERISIYVTLPSIQDGVWKLIPRGKTEDELANASFCVIDTVNEIGYYIIVDT